MSQLEHAYSIVYWKQFPLSVNTSFHFHFKPLITQDAGREGCMHILTPTNRYLASVLTLSCMYYYLTQRLV